MSEPRASAFDPGDLETLAAFIDGRLEGSERDAVVERLANDADYYEVYAETLQFLEAETPTPSSDGMTAIEPPAEFPLDRSAPAVPSRGWWWAAAALAAGLAIVIGYWLWPKPPTSAHSYLAMLDDQPPSTHLDFGVMRSGVQIPDWLSPDSIAVRAATDRLRLESALRRGDGKDAEEAAKRLSLHADRATGLQFGIGEDSLVDAIKREDSRQIRESLEEIESTLMLVVPNGYQFGLWTQSCTWAAEMGDTSFFGEMSTRAFERIDTSELVGDQAKLAELEALIRTESLGTEELDQLRTICDRLGTDGGKR